jgi:hypothetical protein
MNNLPKLEQGSADVNVRYPEFYCGRDSGIFCRPNYLNKGQVCGNHAHNFDHVTLVMSGSVHVKMKNPDGTEVEKDFHAPNSSLIKTDGINECWFLVKAESLHEIFALEDNTVFFCLYSHRDAQGRIVWQADGWDEAFELSRKAYS